MSTLHTIDLNWTARPRSIAAVLLEFDSVRVLIDPGPESTVETLRQHLKRLGAGVESLDAILLTHIHLDHSGATGALVRENPRLPVYVHHIGAPHMADPAKLLASAGKLYGDRMQTLYGDFQPVPSENLRPLNGDEALQFGRGSLEVLYTPGHANHHVTYWDAEKRVAFVGDTAGLRVEGHSFLLPAVPPPDVNIELWNESLDAILRLNPEKLFLTHFGFSHDPKNHIERYREQLATWTALVRRLMSDGLPPEDASRAFVETVASDIKGTLSAADADHYIFNGGLELSWLGLARYVRKQDGTQTSAQNKS